MILKRLFILLCCAPLYAHAAIDASVSVTPTYPSPYQKVVLTLASYSFDVNVANVVWSSQGKTLLSGLGQKTLSITLGDAGQIIPISYKATTAKGESVTGSLSLTPQAVDIVYQTDESYTPPFYEGKTLPGEGSTLRVIAFPTLYESGARIAPENLSYTWYVGGQYLERASGIGRQSATIGMEYLTQSTDVKVMVRSPRGNTAEKSISIYPHTVMPMLYPYDEVLGIDYTRPFIRRIELSKDITLSLEPFYFSTNGSVGRDASYTWYLDGLPITPQEQTLLSLRPTKDAVGTRALSIVLESGKRLLQKARTDVEIIFDTRN